MCSRRWEWSLTLEILLLPHLFLAISIQGPTKYAIPGGNVSLQISNLPKNHKSLIWFYTTDQKIVEWESGDPKYFDTKFKDRATLDLNSGTLHIRKVQKEDSSTYLLRVQKDTEDEDEWKIPLVVLGVLPLTRRKRPQRISGKAVLVKEGADDGIISQSICLEDESSDDAVTFNMHPVPKPVIKVNKTEENSCHLLLSCVIQDQPVNYTWYWESGSFPKQLQNSVLEEVHTPQNYSKSYTCQVSNPVSSQNSTINFTSFCVWASSSGVAWMTTWPVIMVTTLLNLLWT